MTVVINGTTGVTNPNNMTIGNGGGSVATNTAVGTSALAANTSSGIYNTAVGSSALPANTSGTRNTAVGESSLLSNLTGSYNIAIGGDAAQQNTSGSANVAVGKEALKSNTTASYNTAVGYQAGYSNTTGTTNTFIGRSSGYSTQTGDNNVTLGEAAGYSANGASSNTFIGQQSGYYVTSGAKNTIIGRYTGNQNGLDIRTANNYIVLSDGDGNPRMYSDGSGNWTMQNTSGNVVLSVSNSSYSMYLGGGGVKPSILSLQGVNVISPDIYAQTTASAANVNVNSSGYLARSTSAAKYKQDIRDVEDFDINALRPVRYKSKCANDDQTKDHLGLIADEAAEAGFEELVTRNADGEIEGFQYERLTVVLLKKLQTLSAQVEAQAAEIAALKGQA